MYSLIVDCYMDFPLKHKAFILDNQFQIISTKEIFSSDILNYAINNNVDNIKLSGHSEYCDGLKEQLEFQLTTQYSNNNIKIEVI